MRHWYTFTIDDDESTRHASYAKAAFYAQCSHDTNKRPTRIDKGLYQLSRTYIATEEAARRHGFERIVAHIAGGRA